MPLNTSGQRWPCMQTPKPCHHWGTRDRPKSGSSAGVPWEGGPVTENTGPTMTPVCTGINDYKTHLGQPRESETMVSPTHHPSGLAALAKQLFCQSVMNQSMRKKKLSVEMHLPEETCPGKAFSLDFLVLATPQNHSRSLKESRYSDDAPADPARPSGAGTQVSIFLPAGVISMCS